jgi:hypothetical protein
MHPRLPTLLFALLAPVLSACLTPTASVAPRPAGGHQVLFIGNSLTYVNDLPGTLARIAASAGDTIVARSVAFPNFALEDHIADGTAIKAIQQGRWEYVILQQGPSAVEANRQNLIATTRYLDVLIRAVGARPALYQVWPERGNIADFPRSGMSYQMAATAVDGLFLPVGYSWLATWELAPATALYDTDELHPTPLATYLAACVMYERITGRDARALPPRVELASGTFSADSVLARRLQRAAHETIAKYP